MTQQARAHATRGEYTNQFWQDRGLGDRPTTREKFLALTVDELSVSGPHSFNATLICDLLGTTYPMVNHYFGNRNGLVAEAVLWGYREYILGLRAAADEGETASDRLESWIRHQIDWTTEHPGIAVVLEFPEASLEVTTALRAKFEAEMTSLFEFNIAVLMHLVGDVQRGGVTPLAFTQESLPREELLADTLLFHRASTIGLATLGGAVWMAGQRAPGVRSSADTDHRDAVLNAHVATLISLANSPL